MRSILYRASVLGWLVSMTGCADLLGIEAWKDPANTDGAEAENDAGGGDTDGTGNAEPCINGLQDGDETDVDCGGPACTPCKEGAACTADEDCESMFCSPRQLCTSMDGRATCGMEGEGGPSCGDCLPNGDETDVDCGGDACHPCRQGKACLSDADCLSGACVANVCAPGAPGVGCHSNADCASGHCMGAPLTEGVCQ